MYNLILNTKGNLTVKFAKVFTRFAKLKENSNRLMNLTAKFAKVFAGFAKFYVDKALRTLRFMNAVLIKKALACLAVKNTNTYFTL